jgi:Skp family chaperone for outer membrane proteins
VKRNLIIASCLAAVGAAVYLGSQLSAQTPATGTAAAPRTRIAMLNLAYVIKSYKKWEAFQGEFKTLYSGYEAKVNAAKSQMEALAKEIQDPKTSQTAKEAKEKEIKKLQRDIEDIQNEAKAALAKKSDDQMVLIYKEVRDVATRYAYSHNFEMVLHYNDATTQADFDSPMNIARKMNAGALMPLYVANGMDISMDVVNALNAAYASTTPKPGTTPPATGGHK